MLALNAVKRLHTYIGCGCLAAVFLAATVRADDSAATIKRVNAARYAANARYADSGGGSQKGPPAVDSPGYDSTVEGVAPDYADEGSSESSGPSYDETADFGDFSSGLAAAGSSAAAGLAGGYIDPARIRSRVRVRYDSMFGANAPTRAEFLYPTLATLGGPGPGAILAGDLDIQELAPYVEIALAPRLSIFAEFPARFVSLLNTDGAGDIRTGFRLGLMDRCDEALTAQLRFYVPSGDASEALGVGHTSIEPGLLYQREVNQRVTLFGEIHDWINLSNDTFTDGGSVFDGRQLSSNVLRYGVGMGYDLWQDTCADRKLTGVVEIVGWSVLEGLTTPLDGASGQTVDASGDTIVNGKYGVRYSCGQNSVYVGYGHNWSSERWYSDLFRLEVSRAF